jgi:hypothetical protein
MVLHQITVKKHRRVAIDMDEIIALDYNESLNDLKIYLRGGGHLSIEGKKAAKIWRRMSKDLPDLIQAEFEEFNSEDLS